MIDMHNELEYLKRDGTWELVHSLKREKNLLNASWFTSLKNLLNRKENQGIKLG